MLFCAVFLVLACPFLKGMLLSMSHSRFGLPSLYLAIFFLALTGLYAKLIPLNAISIIPLRGMIAALGLALFCLVRKRSLRLPDLRHYVGVYAIGCLLGLHWVTFFHAMQVSTVAVGMLAMFSFPMISILLEPFFSRQPLQMKDVVAGVTMLAGLVIMVGSDLAALQGPVLWGVLWGVLSAVLFTLRNLFQKYHFPHVASDGLMFHQVVAVALLLALFVDYPQVGEMTAPDVLMLALLGLFSTAGAHTLLVFSLKQLPVKTVSLISCSQPVIATLLAWLVICEVPGWPVIIGGGLVLSVAAYETIARTVSSKTTTREESHPDRNIA